MSDLDQMLDQLNQEAAQLATVNPQDLLNDAGAALGQLWQQAEAAQDQNALAQINAAWERAQHLAERDQQANNVLASALTTAKQLAEQRRKIAEELSELTDAIDNMAYDHPKIAELYETLEEMASDNAWETINYSGAYVSDDPGTDMHEGLQQADGIDADDVPDWSTCSDFFHVLMSANYVPAELANELFQFIKDFTPRARAAQAEAVRKMHEAYNARAAAMRAQNGAA